MSGWDDQLPPRDRSEAQEWRPREAGGAGRFDLGARGHIPFPNARGFLERLQMICREHYAVGDKRYHYPGIEEDMAAEEKEAVSK